MARQNRWATFGQAFNAVYDAGTTLGKSIESGKIALKKYEDEDGQKLTGLARDRAQMNDYAAVELKYGDPMEALRMRTGVETLGQNRLKTNYDTDTYDERVYQGGEGETARLNAGIANTKSATGLNVANTGLVNEKTRGMGLDNNFNRDTLNSRIVRGNAVNSRDAAQAIGQTAAYSDSSYSGGLISEQERAKALANADTTRFNSQEYGDSLTATDRQTGAEANLATSTASLQQLVIQDPIYQENYIAGELAKSGQIATIAQIEEQIAKDPKTLQLAEENLSNLLTTARTAGSDLQTQFNLSQDEGYQANVLKTGLSQAELNAVQGAEAVLLAQQSLAVNTFIKEWGKTGNPDDPTSMRNLVKGISQINPVMGQKLSQDYGEHELWEITNRSLRMRAEANDAMQNNGARGAKEVLDKFNGADFGISIETDPDDGSMSMVETDKDGNVVRTIATGADEKAFMQDLNAVLDPASLMEYSMNLVDMDYKRALTEFNLASAKSAGVGTPMSATDMAYRTMVDPDASAADKRLAAAFLMRDSPELFGQVIGQIDFNGVLDAAGGGDGGGDVPAKLPPVVDPNTPVTPQEETRASVLMETLLAATDSKREEILTGEGRALLSKVAPEFLVMEDNKNTAVAAMLVEIQEGNLTLTPEGLSEFTEKFLTGSQSKRAGDRSGDGQSKMQSVSAAMQDDPLSVLNILVRNLTGQIQEPPARANGAVRNNIIQKNAELEQTAADVQELIDAMDGR